MSTHTMHGDDDAMDNLLDRAIAAVLSEAAPSAARRRAVERAEALVPRLASTRQPRGWSGGGGRARLVLVAAALLLVASVMVAVLSRDGATAPTATPPVANDWVIPDPGAAPPPNPGVENVPVKPQYPEPPRFAAMWISAAHATVAEDAPIMVANGGKAPIVLGSHVPQSQAGGLIHVWDWTKSATSRVIEGTELWTGHSVALSPDGKLLVWSNGNVFDLASGKRSTADLGKDKIVVDGRQFRRIGQMQFSPDGGRLAMFITDMDEEVAGRIKGHVVQVVEFPGGKRLCEFPAGEDYALRLAFTRDGKRIVAADRAMNVMIRDAGTGEVVRRFEPAMKSQVIGVAISAQEKHIAAYERADQKDGKPHTGDLLIWDAESGKLLHRLTAAQLHERNGAGPVYGAMRFSPDGRHLAAESGGRLFVIDAATGEIVAALRSNFDRWLQWSADGASLTAIGAIAGSEGGGDHPPGRYDVFPRIDIWDVGTGKLRESVPR